MRNRAIAAAAAVLAGAIVAATYAPVTGFPFVNFDDDTRLLANAWVRTGLSLENVRSAFSSTWDANWSPLTWISHMLDFSLYGAEAGGHHLTNLLLHLLNVGLLFGALRAATGALWRPLAVALLFGLHPVNVESVAWVSERKGLLAVSFGLAALWCYAAGARDGNLRGHRIAALLLALGLMAKAVLVTLPLVFLLLDRWPLDRLGSGASNARAPGWRGLYLLLREKWLYAVIATAGAAATLMAQQAGGGAKSFEALPLPARLANAVVSYALYLGKLVWPTDLAVYYPHPNLPGGQPWESLEISGAAVLLIVLAILAGRCRSPAPRVGLAWFVITLAPMIGVLQVGSQALSDRYLYLPGIGIFIAFVWGVIDLVPARRFAPRLALVSWFVALLLPLALASRTQLDVWRSSERLFRHATQVTKANYNMHYNLANTLKHRGEIEEAIAEYRAAIAIHPAMGQAHFNLANTLVDESRIDEAIEHYRSSVRSLPHLVAPRDALGRILIRKGDLPRALAHFRREGQLRPDSPDVQVKLAHLLRMNGELEAAIRAYQAAAALVPDDTRWSRAAEEVRRQLAGANPGS